MKIVLTVVLVAIFLAAVWSGYRRGLILSAAQLAAIVVALYGAALLAGLFSDRLLPVAEPFAGGYFEGQLDVSPRSCRITTPASRVRTGSPRTPTPRRNTPSSALPPPVSPAGRRGAWPAPRSPCATSRTSRCAPP